MTIRDKVEIILRSDVNSRGDDKRLILLYWEQFDNVDFSNFKSDFSHKATMPESIRRARQLIQEEGKYLPNDEVVLKRRSRQLEMRDSIVNHREVV